MKRPHGWPAPGVGPWLKHRLTVNALRQGARHGKNRQKRALRGAPELRGGAARSRGQRAVRLWGPRVRSGAKETGATTASCGPRTRRSKPGRRITESCPLDIRQSDFDGWWRETLASGLVLDLRTRSRTHLEEVLSVTPAPPIVLSTRLRPQIWGGERSAARRCGRRCYSDARPARGGWSPNGERGARRCAMGPGGQSASALTECRGRVLADGWRARPRDPGDSSRTGRSPANYRAIGTRFARRPSSDAVESLNVSKRRRSPYTPLPPQRPSEICPNAKPLSPVESSGAGLRGVLS